MSQFTAKSMIDGVYIPSALLVVGTAIVKKEWLPYAVALALALSGWKIYAARMSIFFCHSYEQELPTN